MAPGPQSTTSAQTVALQRTASQTIDNQNSKLSRRITRFCPMPYQPA